MPKCLWITSPVGVYPTTHCDRKITWTMEKDDDGNLVRKDKTFCKEHQKLVDIEEAEEEKQALLDETEYHLRDECTCQFCSKLREMEKLSA